MTFFYVNMFHDFSMTIFIFKVSKSRGGGGGCYLAVDQRCLVGLYVMTL